ncbi:hypothetical protein HNV12_29605 [Methanococcoides sp. SA1]|nr:hypothetical protein [Methanococcoides sp. SA1]
MKNKFIISVLILIQITLAQNKIMQPKKIQNEYSIGFNYSNLYTTDDIGGLGINIGISRRKELNNNWQMKTGFNFTTKYSKLNNVVVLPIYHNMGSSEEHIYWENIEIEYSYLNIYKFFELPFYKYKNLKINILFGCTAEINLTSKNKVENIKYEIYDEEKHKYDYWSGDHDIPTDFITNIENSGFSLQAGNSCIYKQFVISVYYDISLNGLDYINNTKFGEKFYTFNTTFGYVLK